MDRLYYIEVFGYDGQSFGFYKSPAPSHRTPSVTENPVHASGMAHSVALVTAETLFTDPYFGGDGVATVRIGKLKLDAEYVFDRGSIKAAQLDREIRQREAEIAQIQAELDALKLQRASA